MEIYDSKICYCDKTIDELVKTVRREILRDLNSFDLPPRIDSEFLAQFVRAKKCRADESVVAIRKYYQNIMAHLEILEGVKSSESAHVFNFESMRILKPRLNRATILYTMPSKWDTEGATLQEVNIAASFVMEELLLDPEFQTHGFYWIFNFADIRFNHIWQMTYQGLKFIVKALFEKFPARVVGIHVVNMSSYFYPIFKITMKLVSKKISSRVHVHQNLESLTEKIPADLLPKVLGGSLEDEDAWDTDVIGKLINENVLYDCYWRRGK